MANIFFYLSRPGQCLGEYQVAFGSFERALEKCKIAIIFLPISLNICFGCLKYQAVKMAKIYLQLKWVNIKQLLSHLKEL